MCMVVILRLSFEKKKDKVIYLSIVGMVYCGPISSVYVYFEHCDLHRDNKKQSSTFCLSYCYLYLHFYFFCFLFSVSFCLPNAILKKSKTSSRCKEHLLLLTRQGLRYTELHYVESERASAAPSILYRPDS